MSSRKPFNLQQWIEANRDLLKPPVGNKNIYIESEDFIVMVVGGPNARKDFHYNESEEFFYQLEGSIQVDIQEDGIRKSLILNPGDIYLLPAKTPHSPIRTAGSVGLVVEKTREGKGQRDGLLWYCENCNHLLHEAYFELTNIETDFLPHFKTFYTSETLRSCSNCQTVMEADARFIK
ncbi:3-hydroxyanthranilate 3,4-dioxygenase [Flavobacterium sp. NKUCC04_CG]|uniref:3-hydroxyanthranilate 3,4-dioxygenase n=1 Tax=Flavobacterium sp. NKUCC04_CG TaxID=2842121 RepID=UPI001C5B1ED6|nr:3-hydroxyanthranilate 3,4-dioxygenase [Flavobacterium sp. NKUCC04_CG]MBW3520182.1 3-hydroxyanthranilate 3,4-dioxygenase [Flavobacterium sp. NKUCC04_CG]